MKSIFSVLATILTSAIAAQSLPNIAIGVIESGAEQELVSVPRSTIVVDATLVTTKFTAGEYARYAQRYLGERAQLSDVTITKIENPRLTLATQDFQLSSDPSMVNNSVTVWPMLGLSPERASAEILSPEQRAQRCAQRLFDNRRLVRDLISGDVGEGVFGAGLSSAIESFEREDRELMALFMGSQTVESSQERFVVHIRDDVQRYMLCRFNLQRGIISVNDIDGEAVYLQITPAQVQDTTIVTSTGKYPAERLYISPNYAQCDLYVASEVVCSAVLPLYEFGARTTVIYDKR